MKTLLKLLVSLAVLAAFAVKAHATATLTITDGVNPTVTVLDNGAGDLNPAVGVILWSGSIGVWNVNTSTGLTYPIQGSATFPNIDLNSVDHSTAAGTLTLTFTDTFTTGAGTAGAQIGGTQDNGSITMNILQNGVAIPGFTTGALTVSPFAATASGLLAGGTYTLSEQVVIVHTAAGGTSFDAALSVPDSGTTVLLLGAGLTLLGFVARLRARLS